MFYISSNSTSYYDLGNLPEETFLSIQHNQPSPEGHSILPLAFQHQLRWIYFGEMPARAKYN